MSDNENHHWTENIQMPDGVEKILLNSVDSTNKFGLRHVLTQPFAVILARSQTAGRGRRGRVWASVDEDNLYCTVVGMVSEYDDKYRFLALLTAINIVNTLNAAGIAAKIKWPNDIYIDAGKAGGVLVDVAIRGSGAQIAVGFGLNWVVVPKHVVSDKLTAAISQVVDVDEQFKVLLTEQLITNLLDQTLKPALLSDKASPLVWPQEDWLIGRELSLKLSDTQVSVGRYNGVDAKGRLCVTNAAGELAYFTVEQVEQVTCII